MKEKGVVLCLFLWAQPRGIIPLPWGCLEQAGAEQRECSPRGTVSSSLSALSSDAGGPG